MHLRHKSFGGEPLSKIVADNLLVYYYQCNNNNNNSNNNNNYYFIFDIIIIIIIIIFQSKSELIGISDELIHMIPT